MLTMAEMESKLRKSERTIRRYVARGYFPGYLLGGELRFKEHEVDEWVETTRVRPGEALEVAA